MYLKETVSSFNNVRQIYFIYKIDKYLFVIYILYLLIFINVIFHFQKESTVLG